MDNSNRVEVAESVSAAVHDLSDGRYRDSLCFHRSLQCLLAAGPGGRIGGSKVGNRGHFAGDTASCNKIVDMMAKRWEGDRTIIGPSPQVSISEPVEYVSTHVS